MKGVSSSVIRISCAKPQNCKKIAQFPVKLLQYKTVINPLFLGDKSTYHHVQLYKAINIPDKIYSSAPTNPYTNKRMVFQIASDSILKEVKNEYLYTKCILILFLKN
jgi:hypothetical protein